MKRYARSVLWTLTAAAYLGAGCKAPPSDAPLVVEDTAAQTDGGCVANPPSLEDSVRFLEQTTFGPTPADVAAVQCQGFGPWLTAQFKVAPLHYDLNQLGTKQHDQELFFQYALTAPDQLRQRVVFALSEILVVSALKLKDTVALDGVANHLNTLIDNAWSTSGPNLTYEQLLYQVTVDPGMGRYLDMVNNNKPTNGSAPNENYARELLQLFSLGLKVLNDDGTPGTRANPTYCTTDPASTYCQNEVEELAHILTGWTYGPDANKWPGPPNFDVPLVANNAHHDTTAYSEFLGVKYTPHNPADAAADLQTALDIITAQSPSASSLPPFLCKQLIQHLVTSNPTSTYVSDCVATWKDDGSAAHLRGNLKAVVRTIFLDAEARRPGLTPPAGYGHLREPVLYISNLLRLLNYQRTDALSIGTGLAAYGTTMGQNVYTPDTVFNYFPPDFPQPGSAGKLLGPEFAIENTATSFARANFVNKVLYGAGLPNSTITLPGPFSTVTDYINWLNSYMLHGTMSQTLTMALQAVIMAPRPGQVISNADLKQGLYLVATSSEYKVER